MDEDLPLAQRQRALQHQAQLRERVKELKKELTNFKGQNSLIKKFLSIYKNKELEVTRVTDKINEYKEALRNVSEICQEFERVDPDNEHHPLGARYDIEADYYENIAEFERLLAIPRGDVTRSNSVFSNDGHTNFPRRRFKLPEANLPTFSGEYQNWLSFRGEYEATIHNQPDLTKADKLSYLRRCLKGPALDKIIMIPVDEKNYDRAWAIIVEAYSDNRLIISTHYKLLLNLPRQTTETAATLSKLVDETRQHVELLKTVNVFVNDETIVAAIENVLHPTTRNAWDEKQEKGVYPKSDTLLDFLSQRSTRFAIRDNTDHKAENKPENTTKHNNKRPYARAFYTTTDGKCPVCHQDNHPLYRCRKFREMDVPNRVQTVKHHSFCQNCLRKGHDEANCPSKHMCWVCEERHNTLIHGGVQDKSKN